MLRAKITGIASYVPDYVLTNEELSHMVDTNDEWITTRVGIKERRILKGEGLGSSYMGAIAVERLLANTGQRRGGTGDLRHFKPRLPLPVDCVDYFSQSRVDKLLCLRHPGGLRRFYRGFAGCKRIHPWRTLQESDCSGC